MSESPKFPGRRISHSTPILGRDNQVLYHARKALVQQLLKRPDIEVLGTKKRIRALRVRET